MNLDNLRNEIDSLDSEIVRLLNERINVVLQIGEAKKKDGAEIYVPSREREVFDKIQKLNAGPLPEESAHAIYREIMSAALALEAEMKIAYLGPEATFTHQAARNKFGASVDYIPTGTISEVFDRVQNRTADYGVVPIENSTEGAVTHTFDQFASTPLRICAEIYLPISLTLLSKHPRDEVTMIFSKQEAFGQCRSWLRTNMPNATLSPVESTAHAVQLALETPGAAAIASAMASDMYKIEVLATNIQDIQGNTTRFLVIGQQYGPIDVESLQNSRQSNWTFRPEDSSLRIDQWFLMFELSTIESCRFAQLCLSALSRSIIKLTHLQQGGDRCQRAVQRNRIDPRTNPRDPPL